MYACRCATPLGPDNAGSGLLIVKWSLVRARTALWRAVPRIDTEAEVPLDVLLPTGIDAAGVDTTERSVPDVAYDEDRYRQTDRAGTCRSHHRIVARLRFLAEMHAHTEMLEFSIGDRVVFQPPGHGQVEGMLTRYNKKTVTIITDDGRQWNVSPTFLSKAAPLRGANTTVSNVIQLGKADVPTV